MASYYVYKHTFPNDKVYIGITSMKPEARWGRDGKGYRRKIKGKWAQPLMAKAILKYGWDNIKHEVLFEGLTKEEAEVKEKELIAQYRSNEREFGYNIENGGNSNGKHSEETKKKLSDANKGKVMSADARKKMSEAKKGTVVTEETRKKLSEAKQGKNHPRYGKHCSEETKQKISNTKVKKPILCIETNVVYESAADAERQTGIDNAHMTAVCKGKRKTAGGFHWAYYTEQIAV